MAQVRRPHGRWFDVLATVLIGLVVTGAALIPAATANSGEQTTIRGDVSIGDTRLAFFPVGFWVPGEDGGPIRGQTDANGDFTLEVPLSRDGYVYAGTEPDAERAIIGADGRQVVRGTIGARVQKPVASPLYQGWDTATARNLAGGASRLHFRLQEAGRIGGTLPIRGSQVRAVQVRRLDGSVVQTPRPDSKGRWVSGSLVPGRYLVAVVPVAPLLPSAVQVDVDSAKTVQADVPAPVTGATISGALQADESADVQSVPVLLQQDDETIASTTTDRSGTYRFSGVAAGDYTVVVGRYPDQRVSSPSPSRVVVPVPGSTPTPTPTPTATASTPTSSAAPSQQVVAPVQRVSDTVQPVSTEVTVPESLGEVSVTSQAAAAGRLAGTVTGSGTDAVQVVVEDRSTGQVLRVVTASADGRWSAGGLASGETYRVWAVTRPEDSANALMGTTDGLATTSTTRIDVVIDRSAASLSGTVDGAKDGTVTVGDTGLLTREGTVDSAGAFTVRGLVPGLYPATVRTTDRLASDPTAVTVTKDGRSQNLQPGPRPATYTGWFISGGDGVPIVSGTATSTDGDVVEFQSRGEDGRLEVDLQRPGVYSYDADSFAGTVPALDGPWWFAAPEGTFTLNDGRATDAGPVVLHVKAR